jgi:hypothetical protein
MNRCDECHRTREALAEVSADRERIRSALRVLIHATEGDKPDPATLASARRAAIDSIAEWNDPAAFRDGMLMIFNADATREKARRERSKRIMNRE